VLHAEGLLPSLRGRATFLRRAAVIIRKKNDAAVADGARVGIRLVECASTVA